MINPEVPADKTRLWNFFDFTFCLQIQYHVYIRGRSSLFIDTNQKIIRKPTGSSLSFITFYYTFCCSLLFTMSDREFSSNDDLSLPKATVQKIVTEILPASSGLAFGKDARDLLIECCVEFITLISSEANEISEKESKKTIACEHITKALEQLGFSEYVKDIVDVASEHKEQLKGREKKANKLEQSGLTAEQLLAMQEEAFRDAAQRHG
ncbi:hypothetical protein EAE96_004702 [Botrytis aclada]|nr:hypothetical protein EAE96_004702 [Botrytis aclada]